MSWLYLASMLVIWGGNIFQIVRLIRTHSTKSFSFVWLFAILISFMGRMPLAFSSGYWVWALSYIVSAVILTTLIILAVYYKKKYAL